MRPISKIVRRIDHWLNMKTKQQAISAIFDIFNQRHVFYHFLKFLKPYWLHQSVVFVLMILGTVSSLAFPYIMKIIIDDVFPDKDYELLIFILLLLLGHYSGQYHHWFLFKLFICMDKQSHYAGYKKPSF